MNDDAPDPKRPSAPTSPDPKTDREARLAAALRANLRRRKARAKASEDDQA